MRGRGLYTGQATFGFIPERNVHGLWSCLVNMVSIFLWFNIVSIEILFNFMCENKTYIASIPFSRKCIFFDLKLICIPTDGRRDF